MMRERVIFATIDNKAVVFNLDYDTPEERSQKFFAAREYFAKITSTEYRVFYCDRSSSLAVDEFLDATDPLNSQFLQNEIYSYSYVKHRDYYSNDLQTDDYSGPLSAFFDGVDHSVDDAKVPEVIKNLGFSIEPEDREVEVTFNPSTQTYDYEVFADMQVITDKRCITIFRSHYKFPSAADEVKLRALIAHYKTAKNADPHLSLEQYRENLPSIRERSLFGIYIREMDMTEQHDTYMAHEYKHVLNKMFTDTLYLNCGDVRLSIEDAYKLEVENERSAYLSQVVNCVNKYLQKGDWSDYSMFDDESSWLAETLAQINDPVQRRIFAMNPANWVNSEMDNFASVHRKKYDEKQFKDNVLIDAEKMPLIPPEEIDHKLFEKIQRLYYIYQIYNPDTGKMETKNLFDHIDETHQVKINNNQHKNIIKPAQDRLDQRLTEFQNDISNNNYDLSLVPLARQVLNDETHQPRFVSANEAVGVATLNPDFTPEQNVPDDKADWSDSLKQYWSQFESYKETAKNNNVYAFEINNDQICYSSTKDVAVSRDSQYETYKRLVAEPSNCGRAINFEKTLSEEQALRLYVACMLNGNKVIGQIPTDFSRLDSLNDIPAADLQKFKDLQNSGTTNTGSQNYSNFSRAVSVRPMHRQTTRD